MTSFCTCFWMPFGLPLLYILVGAVVAAVGAVVAVVGAVVAVAGAVVAVAGAVVAVVGVVVAVVGAVVAVDGAVVAVSILFQQQQLLINQLVIYNDYDQLVLGTATK